MILNNIGVYYNNDGSFCLDIEEEKTVQFAFENKIIINGETHVLKTLKTIKVNEKDIIDVDSEVYLSSI